MKKSILISFVLIGSLLLGISVHGQIVTTDPAIPTADEAVTLTFNATGTGLEGYTGDVYAHTGITVDGNQWQYVIGSWGNTNQPLLTNIGTDMYELELTPSIRDFYGAPANGVITEICLVFRSADGTQQTSPDIFIEVFELGLNISLISPEQTPYFVDPGENIEVIAEATLAESIYLYVDDVQVTFVSGNSLNHTIVAEMEVDTKHWIKVIAVSGAEQAVDSTYYYIRGETLIADQPAGTRDGINYIDDNTITLALHAPYKTSVYVIGDFNDWQIGPEYKLQRTTADANDINTRYWVTIDGLTAGEEYAFQYMIDEGLLLVADPYAEKILDKWNDPWIEEETYPNLKPYPLNKTEGIVSVLQTAQEPYQWQITSFDAPDQENLVIYETLMRDFIDTHDFKTMKDTIQYFKHLGINAIELMPVNEFEGNLSWGYNPSFFFAPDKYYGPKDDFKAFVDECHANGIAVIMDIVLNHAYGQNVMAQMYWDDENNQPAANNIWFNQVCPHEPYCWGSDFDHESEATQALVDRVNHFWMSEYKIDGFRFDFTKGFTNSNSGGSYDATRIYHIKRMADEMWDDFPNAYVILEHFCDNSEEKELANYGCMIWGNTNYNYNEATMGWNDNSNFSWISHLSRGYNDAHVVGYMESHDEERLMAKNLAYGNASGSYDIQDSTIALQRMELAAAFFVTIPGPKMIWQFGELGYDYHINYPGTIGGDDHRLDQKPIRWDYLNDYRRNRIHFVFSSINNLRLEEPAFSSDDFFLSVGGAMKRIQINHSSMNVTILGNFDVNGGNITPNFQSTGYWYDYFSGDSLLVENVTSDIYLEAGEYRIYTDKMLETPTFLTDNENFTPGEGSFVVYPNPSSGDINISLDLENRAEVMINIHDVNGKLVSTIYKQETPEGPLNVKWNATNFSGEKVHKGFYLCSVIIDGVSKVEKLLIY